MFHSINVYSNNYFQKFHFSKKKCYIRVHICINTKTFKVRTNRFIKGHGTTNSIEAIFFSRRESNSFILLYTNKMCFSHCENFVLNITHFFKNNLIQFCRIFAQIIIWPVQDFYLLTFLLSIALDYMYLSPFRLSYERPQK